MGQKTNPIGNRLGFIHGWESNWYGGDNYRDKIVEDDQIRSIFTPVYPEQVFLKSSSSVPSSSLL